MYECTWYCEIQLQYEEMIYGTNNSCNSFTPQEKPLNKSDIELDVNDICTDISVYVLLRHSINCFDPTGETTTLYKSTTDQ